ncbi:hypothetical protein LCGC14_1941500, partial [marine sediment metagenome]
VAGKLRSAMRFVGRMARQDKHTMRQCWRTLKVLHGRGHERILLYGTGQEANIMRLLSRDASVGIVAAAGWDGFQAGTSWSGLLLSEDDLSDRNEPIVVAAVVNVQSKISRLKAAGVDASRLWRLQ